jgi:membrane-bound lytic murein transglycosylase B
MRIPFFSYLLLCCAIGLQATSYAASKKTNHRTSHLATAHSYAKNTDAVALGKAIAQEQNLDEAWVLANLSEAKHVPRIVKLMTPLPAGGKKNWTAYQSRFVTPLHIAAGVAFWQANQDALLRAEREYGVPPRIVLGILGVETIYGRNTGGFRVLDALATLSFDYPKEHPRREARVVYFRGELAQFLALAKQQGRDPASIKGSYAGAMGLPQFMPSSWVKYAVDFDGDGKIDLWTSTSDVIGSVANYFKAYGWKADPARLLGESVALENGDDTPTAYPIDDNFFVITKYNNSYYYAAAVLELGAAIEAEIKTKNEPRKN